MLTIVDGTLTINIIIYYILYIIIIIVALIY